MAKVSLRVYNREIEGMIEGGLLDESVAHCQHILKSFPMHVETYRLLGKSFLEARRYTDAADIFQRVLMAVPDDFVSQVGMSIIRDDEGKLDDAIWHMERAFETQPSNPAIQGELRRLYGRRDGVEPPKIRLSRDALANMYSQGELFNQAIAEIRAVLAEDTNRPDLQVMLARAYFRAGQRVEAAEMAANLLKKYTYCLDALRILVDVLPGTARAENTQVYRQRLGMLDPYSAFTTGSAFSSDQVADISINLERLEFKAGTPSTMPQPNWASSLGIKLADEKRIEPAPDWMTASVPAEQTPSPALAPPESKPAPPKEEVSVPEWMSNVGWQESSGKAEEKPEDLRMQQSEEPLAKAEIPDWLKSMAPQDATGELEPGSKSGLQEPSSTEEEDAEWLSKLSAAAANAKQEPSQPLDSPHDDGGLPDWLKQIGDRVSPGESESGAIQNERPPQEESIPEVIQPAPLQPEAEAAIEPPLDLHPVGESETKSPDDESRPLNIEDDAMAWLERLAAKQGASSEESLTKPEDQSTETPDWLREGNEPTPGSVEKEPSLPAQASPPLPPTSEVAERKDIQEPNLREEFQPIPEPSEEAARPIETEKRVQPLPDHPDAVKGPEVVETPPAVTQQSAPSPEWMDQSPKELTSKDETLGAGQAQEDATITSWLKKQDVLKALGKTQPDSEKEQPASPAPEPAEELPDWLKGLNKPVGPVEKPKPAEEIPDWLRKTVQPESQDTTVVIPKEKQPETENLGWTDEIKPRPEPPAPTSPGEWIPVGEKPVTSPQPDQVPETPPAAVETPVTLRVLGGTGMLARIPEQDKDGEFLAVAQTSLDSQKLNEAMQAYAKLIKKNRLLDEVIHDLREAIYRFPVDIIVWQTLGDAYMRANRLQDALDAYTKAEELLR